MLTPPPHYRMDIREVFFFPRKQVCACTALCMPCSPPGLLVERLVRPLRVQPAHLVGQHVVRPHEDGVDGGQDRLLAVPRVTRLVVETKHRLYK